MTCVHPVPPVLAGEVRLLIGDPVDRDQSAVEDRVREQPDPGHRGGQVVGGGGEQVDGFADVAPGSGDADLESGRQADQGVAVAQAGQGDQGLQAGLEAPPAGSALGALDADEVGEVVEALGPVVERAARARVCRRRSTSRPDR